jgi:hypothetical protein
VIGFLQPWVLLALPLAALPLLLHLIQRRDPPSVVFPAVRYLRQVSEEHQRRLRIRHLLLLLVRTALILLLVLAAANPTARTGGSATHAPTALVVILDNSPSSGAVRGGDGRPEFKTAAGVCRQAGGDAVADYRGWRPRRARRPARCELTVRNRLDLRGDKTGGGHSRRRGLPGGS